MTLDGYIAAMERSRKGNDLVVVSYLRRHRTQLLRWLAEFGAHRTPAVREELLQELLLGACEVVAKGGGDACISQVRNQMARHRHADKKRDLREAPFEEGVNGAFAPVATARGRAGEAA